MNPFLTSYNFKAALIGGATGAIVGFIAGVIAKFEDILDSTKYGLKLDLSKDVLNCPLMIKYNYDFQVKFSQETCVRKFQENLACYKYKEASTKHSLNANKVCSKLNETIKYIDNEINISSNKILLILGEKHNSQQSLLLQMSILSHLKNQNLSSKILCEISDKGALLFNKVHPKYYNFLHICKYASWELGYKVLGYDNQHEVTISNHDNILSKSREDGFKEKILESFAKNFEKVTIVTTGMSHLPELQKIKLETSVKLLTINTAKSNQFDNYVVAFNHDNHERKIINSPLSPKFKAIKSFDLEESIESLTLKQVIELYEYCSTVTKSNHDSMIYSKGTEECDMAAPLEITYNGCDSSLPLNCYPQ